MLSREDNELLCRVGPGAPMGDLLREFWTVAVRSQALEADGAPVRVRLFGENFVAFRASDGRVGFFDEGCPHRCTSLALARNEDNALTCIFHGWKIDVSGKVVEVPSEPPERRAEFAAKVRVRHYPVREAAGAVWVYLGRSEQPPQFYNFEFAKLPASHCVPMRAVVHCNWFQAFEQVLDSAHLGILHQSWLKQIGTTMRLATLTSPVFETLKKPYGFREGAIRDLGDGTYYARIREVVFPYFSFIPNDPPQPNFMMCAVPIDDEWNAQWLFWYDPHQPLASFDHVPHSQTQRASGANLDNFCTDMGGPENMWNQDRKAMKEGHFTGITKNFIYEDFAIEEAMGPIMDRSREFLGRSDTIILTVRRALLQAARDFRQGKQPSFMDRAIDYGSVRAAAVRYDKSVDWRAMDPLNPPPGLSVQW
ncbi:MAG TPA: Rieske 2Fe-2S domain-containing protein [Candidatus Binataceae bacterium]|nr:Rieske 2Fe-2S domain-containing protein [Candidatus Binataceae bacterium]